ncbi:MAG: recombinase family protein [Candidatus Bipolaricaulaceae bacterium]
MTISNLAVGYCRVSTEEQAAFGASIAAQAERLRAYARLAGLELHEILADEGVSASVPLAARPQGRRLAALVESGRVQHVVTAKLDRLFRNALEAMATLQAWDKKGVALHLVDQGGSAVNTRTALGQFVLLILAGVAEMERNLVRERTKAVLDFKKRNGEVYNHEPYGFRRREQRLIPDPQELAALALAKELRAQGLSFRAICAELERQGFRPKRGRVWHPGTVHRLLRRTYGTA